MKTRNVDVLPGVPSTGYIDTLILVVSSEHTVDIPTIHASLGRCMEWSKVLVVNTRKQLNKRISTILDGLVFIANPSKHIAEYKLIGATEC